MKPLPEKGGALPSDWLEHAKSDLKLAHLARESKEVLPEQVCFHAQQTAEKAIKAVLLFKRVEFPLVHDIEELLELAKQGGLVLPPEVSGAGILTPYAVEARYPGQPEEITSPEADEAIRTAQAVLKWATEILRTP
jgi:HEPN domain-containing protein